VTLKKLTLIALRIIAIMFALFPAIFALGVTGSFKAASVMLAFGVALYILGGVDQMFEFRTKEKP
jgi:predicted phage tail protein